MNRPLHWASSFTLLAALAAGTVLITMGAVAQTDDDAPTAPTASTTASQQENTR